MAGHKPDVILFPFTVINKGMREMSACNHDKEMMRLDCSVGSDVIST